MIITDEPIAKRILARENYYNLINGYKNPFLERDLSGKTIVPETYKKGCTFEEVYSLYSLDRDLRMLILSVLLRFETHFKTTCAYHFSQKNPGDYAYLSIDNYAGNNSLSKVLSNLATLSGEVNKNTRKLCTPYIHHYINNHDCVPLWVLVNALTIGNMSYFYDAVTADLQDQIAREFSQQYRSEYGSKESVQCRVLQDIIKMVNMFRNVCAHEEVLFLFKLNKIISGTQFLKFFKVGNINEDMIKKSNLFTLIAIIKLVLPKEEYSDLINGIDCIFNKYRHRFSSVSFDDIIELAGFPVSWKILINENL